MAPAVSSAPDPSGDAEHLKRLRRLLEVYRNPLPGALQDLPGLLDQQAPPPR